MTTRSFLAVLTAWALFVPGSRADDFLLVMKSGTIADTKADGRAWDLGFGKKAWPDPYVRVRVHDKDGAQVDFGETFVVYDTFTPVWNKEVATVRAGQRVHVEVWDKDLKYDDLIGRHEFVLTEELLAKRTFTLQFGQVKALLV